MEIIFSEITLIICFVAVLAVVFKFLRQPSILAYILTGVLIGPLGLVRIQNQDVLQLLSTLGITLLLFMLGLEMRIKDFSSIGKSAILLGFFQIIITFVLSYFLSVALGFQAVSSLYIALALTFSSTIIVVKLLSDKRDLHSLYGRISVGTMLIQDFVAIFLLIFLAGSDSGSDFLIKKALLTVILGVFLFAAMLWLGRKIIPLILDKIAVSSELLFLLSLAWLILRRIFKSPPK